MLLHMCHLFSGPPRVDGRWGLLRVLAMANSVAVSVAVWAPSDLPEVCPLRVCTLEGRLCSVTWELSLVLVKSQPPERPTTTPHPTMCPQPCHTRDWTFAPDEW